MTDSLGVSFRKGRVGAVVSAICAILTSLYGPDFITTQDQEVFVHVASACLSALSALLAGWSKVRELLARYRALKEKRQGSDVFELLQEIMGEKKNGG